MIGKRGGSALARKMDLWARLVAATLAKAAIILALSLAMWAAAPAILGWHPTTVVTGSMEPRIHPGDVVVARPVPTDELRPGQVLLVDDPDHHDRLRLHRLVRTTPDGSLVLRGDANAGEDSTPVDPRAVHGVGFLRVPYVATPILWIQNQAWTNLAILLAVILTLVSATGLDRDATPASEPGPSPSGPGDDPTPPTPAEPTTEAPALTGLDRGP
jgi:signal peptidase